MSCFINEIKGCGLTVGGIQRVWLVRFGDIHSFEYATNAPYYIENYAMNTIPTELLSLRYNDSLTSSYSNGQTIMLDHELKLTFKDVKAYNQEQFQKTFGDRFSIIVKDNNNRYFLMGEDTPVKVTDFQMTTGTQGGESIYNITFKSRSAFNLKEIKGYDADCFSSFTPREIRQSTFFINDASIFDFSGQMGIIADTSTLIYTPATPLQPTLWGNPAQVASDQQVMRDLLGSYPYNMLDIQLFYDSLSDTAIIVYYSDDTSFTDLTFNTNTPIESEVKITLNLQFTLGTLQNVPSTTISVTDSDSNVVYSGSPTTQLYGLFPFVSGIGSNSYIEVSSLYPTGTTLTLTVDNVSSCETKTYVYEVEPLGTCIDETEMSMVEGRLYSVTFPKFALGNAYRDFKFHFDGFLMTLYGGNVGGHSDFSTFVNDFTNSLSSVYTSIDLNTVNFQDLGSEVQIQFVAPQNLMCYVRLFGQELGNTETLRIFQASTSVVGQLFTTTQGNRITFTDEFNFNLAGNNNDVIDTNDGIVLEDTSLVDNETINRVGIQLSAMGYDAAVPLLRNVTSTICPNSNSEIFFKSCFNQAQRFVDKLYYKVKMTGGSSVDLSSQFIFDFDSGSGSINLSSPLTISSDFILLSQLLKNNVDRFYLLDINYNHFENAWYIEFMIDISDVFNSFSTANGWTSNVIDTFEVVNIIFDEVVNPAVIVEVNYPTIDPLRPFITQFQPSNQTFAHQHTEAELAFSLMYNNVLGNLLITNIPKNDLFNGGAWRFTFYDSTGINVLAFYDVVAPATTDTFAINAALAANGYTPSQVQFVNISNTNGLNLQFYYDLAASAFMYFDFSPNNQWFSTQGKYQNFWVLTPDADTFNILADSDDGNCIDFKPNRLSSYFTHVRELVNYFYFIPKPLLTAPTTNVTKGDNVITISDVSELQVGMIITLSPSPAFWYLITAINGSNVTLLQKIQDATGLYGVYVAGDTKIKSYTTNNDFSLAFSSVAPTIIWGVTQGSHPERIKLKDSVFTSDYLAGGTTPNAVTIVGVLYTDNDMSGGNTIWAHSDNIIAEIEFTQKEDLSNYEAKTYTPSLVGAAFPATVNQYEIVSYSYRYDLTNVSSILNIGVNGDGWAISESTGLYNPTACGVQTFGGRFDGIGYQNGFIGRYKEFAIIESGDYNEIAKLEGYYAWKYNMVALLPSLHPYKNTKPTI